jgi:hypothetical protein
MTTNDIKQTCACGEPGVYYRPGSARKDGTKKLYARCRACHNKFMREQMRKRYATEEGRQKILDACKRYYKTEKGKAALARSYQKKKELQNG